MNQTSCRKCGECCRRINFFVPLQDPLASLFSAHYNRDVQQVGVFIDHRCHHLRDDHLCDIYNERPDFCRMHTCQNDGTVIVVAGGEKCQSQISL